MKLAEIYALIKPKISSTEELIKGSINSDVQIVGEMGKYITESGGKRIRPALLCLCAAACGYSGDKDVRYGVVYEFLHTATLIHDDIIDKADTRRGRTVMNRKYGTSMSILFGDWLFNTAMEMAIRDDDFRIVRLINRAVNYMIEGEIVQADRNFQTDLNMDQYLDLIKRKTAYVFAAASQTAGTLANVGEEVEKSLFNYGLNVGIAFQLIDDYFDYNAKAKKIGKPVGSDLREGKITYPVLLLLERGDKQISKIVKQGFRSQEFSEEEINYLIAEMKKHNIMEDSRDMALQYALKAQQDISVLPASRYVNALKALPEYIVVRDT